MNRRALILVGALLLCTFASLRLWLDSRDPRQSRDFANSDLPSDIDSNASSIGGNPRGNRDSHFGHDLEHDGTTAPNFQGIDPALIPEGEFKRGLMAMDDAARAQALHALATLGIPLKDSASLSIDEAGGLIYRCTLGNGPRDEPDHAEAVLRPEDPAILALAETFFAEVPSNAPPIRHSKPGAPNVIYLDFTGHLVVNTAWNTGLGSAASYDCLPYNSDLDPLVFGTREQAEIVMIWERVADTFRAFDVDVTTEEPAVMNNRTARVLITHHRDATGNLNPLASGASGIAYLNVFGNPDYAQKHAISFVYTYYRSPGDIAVTASHEVGHNLGLGHDGTLFTEYYSAHRAGPAFWSPIMGSGVGDIQQWSNGAYHGSNNSQDDLQIMSAKLTYAPDDIGNQPGSARDLVANGPAVSGWGEIGSTTDADYHSFTSGGGPAQIHVRSASVATWPNARSLEFAAEIRDEGGSLIARVEPTGAGTASFNLNLGAGTFRLLVQGSGFGNPFDIIAEGFTAYGSLGGYSIEGSITPPAAPVLPFVLRHPESQSVFEGNDPEFSVSARGNPATTFQWQKSEDGGSSWAPLADSPAVSGSTSAKLTLPGVTFEADGWLFRCVVTNVAGSATSNSAMLRVSAKPRFLTQPESQFPTSGGNATFTAVVIGSAPLAYQWRKNGASIPGAIGSTLAIPGATASDAGDYTLVVSNTFGSTTSSVAVLGVDKPPAFVIHPQSTGIAIGSGATLSAGVHGTAPLSFQWLKGGVPIPGATQGSLVLSNAIEADSGSYAVSVSNAFGTATSNPAVVIVGTMPAISVQPVSATVLGGQGVSFSVSVSGTMPFTYQWFRNGQAITGATGASFNLASAGLEHEGDYTVRVVNPIGSIVSSPAVLVVNFPPAIISQPQAQIVLLGRDATFSVIATGKPSPSFQWKKDGVNIPGANASTLLLAGIGPGDAGSYSVTVSNAAGSVESTSASLTPFTPIPVTGSKVAAGTGHSLFVDQEGRLWATGQNTFGQLGDGTTTNRIEPVEVAQNVTSVAAAVTCSFFIKTDGTLWAMGRNDWGHLGLGGMEDRSTPTLVAEGVSAVSTGGSHTLFLKSDGTLWGMGSHVSGQLGVDLLGTVQTTPIQVAQGVSAMAAGSLHSLFVKADGTGWAFGYNVDGQLGTGTTGVFRSPVQVASGLSAVSAGGSHSIFLGIDGTVWAVGGNSEGQLGDGTTQRRLTMLQVASNAIAIEAGPTASFIIRDDNSLWTMGRNLEGQLGRTGDSLTPGLGMEGVADAALGSSHMILLGLDATVWTTGDNDFGQLGDGRTARRRAPFRIRPPQPPEILFGPRDAFGRTGSRVVFEVLADGGLPIGYQWIKDGVEIPGATANTLSMDGVSQASLGSYSVVVSNSAGSIASEPVTLSWIEEQPLKRSTIAVGGNISLFIGPDGRLWGMGSGEKRQLGDVPFAGSPVPVPIMDGVASIVTGWDYSMAIKEDGSLWTWGGNWSGVLGHGMASHSENMKQVASGVVSVAAGVGQSYFVKSDGTLWGLGSIPFRQQFYSLAPVLIDTGVKTAAAGTTHCLYLRSDGTLWGIAEYPGPALGQASSATSLKRPVLVATDVKDVAACEGNSLFLKNDGTLWGMGTNSSSQLGDGTSTIRETPVLVASGVASVASGRTQSMFIKTDGTLWGMGANFAGQLGLTASGAKPVPVLIANNVAEAATNDAHSLIRGSDGSVWVTGANFAGQLGDGGGRDRGTFYRIDPPSGPFILGQNSKEYGAVGSTITIRVLAEGGTQLHYQWARNGVVIPGATSASLTLTDMTEDDFASYTVVVQNEGGVVASNAIEVVPFGPLPTPEVRVSVGPAYSYFLRGDGSLWGAGHGWMLTGVEGSQPSPIWLMSDVRAMSKGASTNFVIKRDDSLWWVGAGDFGQTTSGPRFAPSNPLHVADGVAFAAMGSNHGLFVKRDGTLWGVGNNSWGQLGDGTLSTRTTPIQMATGVIGAAGGFRHSVFIRADGSLWVTGQYYPTGQTQANTQLAIPFRIAEDVVEVAAASWFTVFRKSDGTVWAFGENNGRFGNGAYAGSTTPVMIASDVASIAAGYGHTLLLKTDGTLWGTGGNSFGELGDGSNFGRLSFEQITSDVVAVAAASFSTMFWKADGTLWAMGQNHYGQLGDGTLVDRYTPVSVATISELAITAQPAATSVTEGQSTSLSVTVAAYPAATYQWRKDGIPIIGATSSTLQITNAAVVDAGNYSVVVSNSTGSVTSNEAYLNVTAKSDSPRLINISMRAFAGSGADTLIVGFYIAGTGSKTVLIRGIGPKLLDYNVPSVVSNPRITLYKDQTVVATNDDWVSSLAPEFSAVGAFALDPGSKDSAMLATLEPGGYTIHMVNDGPTAEALIEVYDRSRDAGTRLVNISSRLRIRAGQTAILGTILTGGQLGVLTRNVGPGLLRVAEDLTAEQVLPDPKLTVYSGETPIGSNDDWELAMQPYFVSTGAFGLDAGSKDAAIRSQFQVGGYTIHAVSNTGEGIAIIEIYESP